MNSTIGIPRGARLLGVLLAASLAGAAWAAGNIDATQKYAWAENIGWLNFNPADGGAAVVAAPPRFLSGYIWAENIGWIKLGNGNGGPYANTGATDWGVNIVGNILSGYAWSENAGWLTFSPAASPATIRWSDGKLSGYAWGENVGWVHLAAPPDYGVQTTARQYSGMIIVIR